MDSPVDADVRAVPVVLAALVHILAGALVPGQAEALVTAADRLACCQLAQLFTAPRSLHSRTANSSTVSFSSGYPHLSLVGRV